MISILRSLWTLWRYKRKYNQNYPIADPNGPMCGIINMETGEYIWSSHTPNLELEEAVLGTRKLIEKLEARGYE